jgi:hypothetical protein
MARGLTVRHPTLPCLGPGRNTTRRGKGIALGLPLRAAMMTNPSYRQDPGLPSYPFFYPTYPSDQWPGQFSASVSVVMRVRIMD